MLGNEENKKKFLDYINSEEDNIILIYGPIGSGKTIFWKESLNDYNCIIYDNENKKSVQNIKEEIQKIYGFNFFMKNVIILEDTEEDKQKFQILFDEFPKMKFVLTSSIKNYVPSLTNEYKVINIEIPNENLIQEYFKTKSKKINKTKIKTILKQNENDIRQLFIQLENNFMKDSKDKLLTSIYSVVNKVFSKERTNMDLMITNGSLDIFSIPPMIHENYVTKCKTNKILLKNSLDVCYGDILHTYMYKNADWDFIPYVICQSILNSSYNCYPLETVKFGSIISKILNCQTRKKTTLNIFQMYNVNSLDELQCIYEAKCYKKNGVLTKLKKKEQQNIYKILDLS